MHAQISDGTGQVNKPNQTPNAESECMRACGWRKVQEKTEGEQPGAPQSLHGFRTTVQGFGKNNRESRWRIGLTDSWIFEPQTSAASGVGQLLFVPDGIRRGAERVDHNDIIHIHVFLEVFGQEVPAVARLSGGDDQVVPQESL
jgi:hypothetical protein